MKRRPRLRTSMRLSTALVLASALSVSTLAPAAAYGTSDCDEERVHGGVAYLRLVGADIAQDCAEYLQDVGSHFADVLVLGPADPDMTQRELDWAEEYVLQEGIGAVKAVEGSIVDLPGDALVGTLPGIIELGEPQVDTVGPASPDYSIGCAEDLVELDYLCGQVVRLPQPVTSSSVSTASTTGSADVAEGLNHYKTLNYAFRPDFDPMSGGSIYSGYTEDGRETSKRQDAKTENLRAVAMVQYSSAKGKSKGCGYRIARIRVELGVRDGMTVRAVAPLGNQKLDQSGTTSIEGGFKASAAEFKIGRTWNMYAGELDGNYEYTEEGRLGSVANWYGTAPTGRTAAMSSGVLAEYPADSGWSIQFGSLMYYMC